MRARQKSQENVLLLDQTELKLSIVSMSEPTGKATAFGIFCRSQEAPQGLSRLEIIKIEALLGLWLCADGFEVQGRAVNCRPEPLPAALLEGSPTGLALLQTLAQVAKRPCPDRAQWEATRSCW